MSASRTNVVLLSIDALRADHMSCFGYDRRTTPNLDRFAGRSVTFTRAYSASSHTREAVPALLTGEYPDRAVDSSYELDTESIATRLRSRGYATGAFHSNPFLSAAYGYDEGFDRFYDSLYLGTHKLVALAQRLLDKLRNRHYVRADLINDLALRWIDRADRPFFLWNHYMDTHGPYEPPGSYETTYAEESIPDSEKRDLYARAIDRPESITAAERTRLIDLYDAEIRYVDEQVGAFLDALRERGLFEDTLIVLTADHGDAFGERGYYEHPRRLDDELLHVPLVVSTDRPSTRIDAPTSLVDVAPLLMDEVDRGTGDRDGRPLLESLAETTDDRTVFAQASGEGDHSHLRRFAARNRSERAVATYDMETEEIDLGTQTDEAIADRLFDHITDRVRRDRPVPRDLGEEDGAIEERLSALGYR